MEARERAHDDETRARLADVFGGAERWGDTARGVLWAIREVLVPSFTGTRAFEIQVQCSADLELATTRYLQAVPDGMVPLAFHFSGSVLYRGPDDRLQITQVPWHATARYALPVETWHAAVGNRGGLVRVSERTFEALRRHQLDRGLHSLEDAVTDLLEAAQVEVRDRDRIARGAGRVPYEGYALYPYTPARSRTQHRRRSGSRTPRPTPSATRARSTRSASSASRGRGRVVGGGALPRPPASATRRPSAGSRSKSRASRVRLRGGPGAAARDERTTRAAVS